MSAQNNPGSAAKIAIEERRSVAIEQRKNGKTYAEIAQYVREQEGFSGNYDKAQAYRDVMAELKKLSKQNTGKAEELRALESERLNEIVATFFPKAVNGDYGAADRYFGAHDRIVRLWGLAVPTQIQANKDGSVTVSGGDGTGAAPPVVIYIPDNGRGDSAAARVEGQPPTEMGVAGDAEGS